MKRKSELVVYTLIILILGWLMGFWSCIGIITARNTENWGIPFITY